MNNLINCSKDIVTDVSSKIKIQCINGKEIPTVNLNDIELINHDAQCGNRRLFLPLTFYLKSI